jgi:hypothetical protein
MVVHMALLCFRSRISAPQTTFSYNHLIVLFASWMICLPIWASLWDSFLNLFWFFGPDFCFKCPNFNSNVLILGKIRVISDSHRKHCKLLLVQISKKVKRTTRNNAHIRNIICVQKFHCNLVPSKLRWISLDSV